MSRSIITVHTRMDYKTLRAFALFDTFLLKRRAAKPALFAVIMTTFSLICFFASDHPERFKLGWVLLGVGLILPAVYVGMYVSQVKEQAKKLRLPRKVYSLALSKEGITVTNDMKTEESVQLEWAKLPGAFRMKHAVYLYATPARAFILPNGQSDATDAELWQMIEENLPKGRARVKK